MIGIGITSTPNRPEHLKMCLDMISKHTDLTNVKVYYYIDTDKKGVAYGKNMCLYNLQGCEHVVLFDDDCFPKKDGWLDFFTKSGHNHLLYMTPKHYQKLMTIAGIEYYGLSAGAFMYMTKKAIDTVGYFNPEYGRYGYEHAGYTHRIYRSKLIPTKYPVLVGTSEYLHSLDINKDDNHLYDIEHKPSLTKEEYETNLNINNPIYMRETGLNEHIRYEFTPNNI